MQRGNNVFDRSIEGLIKLNDAGFGVEGSGLYLDLVYNPLGAFLPPPQEALQSKYKEELVKNFGIEFNDLFTMTNMPIKRFADFLYRRGTYLSTAHTTRTTRTAHNFRIAGPQNPHHPHYPRNPHRTTPRRAQGLHGPARAQLQPGHDGDPHVYQHPQRGLGWAYL